MGLENEDDERSDKRCKRVADIGDAVECTILVEVRKVVVVEVCAAANDCGGEN